MAGSERITRIAPGTFRVDVAGRSEIVYVAGPPDNRWAFWNGYVFRAEQISAARTARTASGPQVVQSLSAPMPATVIRLLVTAGSQVTQGDTILVLEAMKMELPIRALSDGTVKAVRCREGELVKADQTLVEIE
jgi:3-methylcrotonyl-CoA carboxylase alpha subunit